MLMGLVLFEPPGATIRTLENRARRQRQGSGLSKIIVVTGAGIGLGRTLARRFAADGDRVVLLGRTLSRVEAAAAEIGERAMAVGCDVSQPDEVREAFSRIAERFPKIDVLINNAAIFEPSTIAEASDDHLARTIGTNLLGSMYCARSAIPMMERGGHIINVSSESIDLPFAHLIAYQASKAGLERFSLNLHRELEETGVRVTIVRAGQMMEEGKVWNVDPEAARRFAQANLERGLNLRTRPISQFTSMTGVFRTLVDLPPDVHVVNVQMHARNAG
jgi:NAD(P)-dependent dehydrogenase (short-subunit alcohol dehydrogenase family)